MATHFSEESSDSPAMYDWAQFVALIQAPSGQKSRCWHPEPAAELIQMPNGSNVAVLEGPAAYQLTTGEIITL